MILPDFVLASRVNQHWQYSGADHPDRCIDATHFKSYTDTIEYVYNSRGFRDKEWPQELHNAIWCIGDSFTTGVGSPVTSTWPYLLAQALGQRTINVSMDGASNSWIARKALGLLQTVAPRIIVIQWSYSERRECADTTKSDEDRRLSHLPLGLGIVDGLLNFQQCVQQVEQNKGNCQVIHSIIPQGINFPRFSDVQQSWTNIAGPDWPVHAPDKLIDIPGFVVEELKQHQAWEFVSEYYHVMDLFNNTVKDVCYLGMISQIDLARDGHHYDIRTATAFVDAICQCLREFGSNGVDAK